MDIQKIIFVVSLYLFWHYGFVNIGNLIRKRSITFSMICVWSIGATGVLAHLFGVY